MKKSRHMGERDFFRIEEIRMNLPGMKGVLYTVTDSSDFH